MSQVLYRAKVLFEFASSDTENELSVAPNTTVEVLDNSDADWHLCRQKSRVGYVPSNFLDRVPDLPPRRATRPAPPPVPSRLNRAKSKPVLPTNSIISSTSSSNSSSSGNSNSDNNNNSSSSSSSISRAKHDNDNVQNVTLNNDVGEEPDETTDSNTNDNGNNNNDDSRSDKDVATAADNKPVKPLSTTIRIRQKKTEHTASSSDPALTPIVSHLSGVLARSSSSPTMSVSSGHNSPSSVKSTRSLWEQLQDHSEQHRQNEKKKKEEVAEKRTGLSVLEKIKKRKEQELLNSETLTSKSFHNLPSNGDSRSHVATSPVDIPFPPKPSHLSSTDKNPQDNDTGQLQDHRSTVLKLRQDLERKGLVFGPKPNPPSRPIRSESSSPSQPEIIALNDTDGSSPSPSTKRANRRSVFFSRLSKSFSKMPFSDVASSPSKSSEEFSPSSPPPTNKEVEYPNSPVPKKITVPIKISNLNSTQKNLITLLSQQFAVYLRRRRLDEFTRRNSALSAARIRKNLVDELYTTEKSYYKNLETTVDIFLNPLRQKKLLKKKEVEDIFGSIEQVKQINYEILTQLEEEMQCSVPRIGRVIKSMSPFLRAYTDYVNQYDDANALYDRSVNKNKKFSNFLEKQYTLPQCVGLDLPSFLIQPVQRIPRYRMLLADIIKRTPEDHVDYNDLVSGLASIMSVASLVNERKRQVENSKMLQNLSPRLREIISDFVQPHRRLVITVDIKATQWHLNHADDSENLGTPRFEAMPFHMFLFNDLLLFVPMSELQQFDDSETYPAYLAFCKIGQGVNLSLFIDTFHKSRRVRWKILFDDVENREKNAKLIQESSDNSYKSACSKLGEGFDLRLLQEVETTRLELGAALPQTRAELLYHRTMLKTLSEKRAKISIDLEANRVKLEELQRLVDKQQADMEELAKREEECIENEKSTCDKVDVMSNTTEECDKMLMLVLNKESQAFEHLFNAPPSSHDDDLPNTSSNNNNNNNNSNSSNNNNNNNGSNNSNTP